MPEVARGGARGCVLVGALAVLARAASGAPVFLAPKAQEQISR